MNAVIVENLFRDAFVLTKRQPGGTAAGERYAELLRITNTRGSLDPAEGLATRLEQLATAGGLHSNLRQAGVPEKDLSVLAAEAAEQWTGKFNPRPFDINGALEVYQCAF